MWQSTLAVTDSYIEEACCRAATVMHKIELVDVYVNGFEGQHGDYMASVLGLEIVKDARSLW